jgi:hypothetical protein
MAEHDRKSQDIRLPETLAVFPLRNALLLPQGRLPLNIFEPRYLAMTDYALGHGRLIGMVRERGENTNTLYDIGCAGRISTFMETDDGRYMITLTGFTRFHIKHELTCDTPFRQVAADWAPFKNDLWQTEREDAATREKLLDVLVDYLNEAGLKADWDTIEDASAETIATSIAMNCPFSPDEKQAILEATSLTERVETLIALMQMSIAEQPGTTSDQGDKSSLLQ